MCVNMIMQLINSLYHLCVCNYHLLARLALDAASPAPALLEAAVAATD